MDVNLELPVEKGGNQDKGGALHTLAHAHAHARATCYELDGFSLTLTLTINYACLFVCFALLLFSLQPT